MKTKLLIGMTIIVATLILVVSMKQPAVAANCKWLAGEWICSTWQIQPTWTPPPPEPYPYSEPLVYIYEEVYPYPAPIDESYPLPLIYIDDNVYSLPYPVPQDDVRLYANVDEGVTDDVYIDDVYIDIDPALKFSHPVPTPPGLIMKSERWIEVDGVVTIYLAP